MYNVTGEALIRHVMVWGTTEYCIAITKTKPAKNRLAEIFWSRAVFVIGFCFKLCPYVAEDNKVL